MPYGEILQEIRLTTSWYLDGVITEEEAITKVVDLILPCLEQKGMGKLDRLDDFDIGPQCEEVYHGRLTVGLR